MDLRLHVSESKVHVMDLIHLTTILHKLHKYNHGRFYRTQLMLSKYLHPSKFKLSYLQTHTEGLHTAGKQR